MLFISDWFFLIVSISFYKFSLSSFILSLSSLGILITGVLYSVSSKVVTFSLFTFWGSFVSFFHLGHMSLSPNFACLTVFFHLLGSSAMSPSLGGVTLCSRSTVLPIVAVSLVT